MRFALNNGSSEHGHVNYTMQVQIKLLELKRIGHGAVGGRTQRLLALRAALRLRLRALESWLSLVFFLVWASVLVSQTSFASIADAIECKCVAIVPILARSVALERAEPLISSSSLLSSLIKKFTEVLFDWSLAISS